MNLSEFAAGLEIIHSEASAKNCDIDGMNIVLIDLPQSKKQLESLLAGKQVARIYAHFYQDDIELLNTMPTREHFKWMYAFLCKKVCLISDVMEPNWRNIKDGHFIP